MRFTHQIALLFAVFLVVGCEFVLGFNDLEVNDCSNDDDCAPGQRCGDSGCELDSGAGGMGTDGICMSPATFDGDVYAGCLDEYCCGAFEPCFADASCAACINDSSIAGCFENPLYAPFAQCFNDSCASSVCGSTLFYPKPALNTCINRNCCDVYSPCEQDPACNGCLQDPSLSGCESVSLFASYQACRTTNCPDDICGTNVVFNATYYNDVKDKNYERIACAQTNCCTELQQCADPSMNGHAEGTDPEVGTCLDCVADQPSCVEGAVKDAADAYNNCMMQNCPIPA